MRFSIFVILWFILAMPSSGQIFHQKRNAFGEDGLKTGKWITYWDDAKRIPMSKEHYEKGREVGVSKAYHQNGNLRLKFRYRGDRIRVKYFTIDRKLDQKGFAQIEFNKDDVHYYWHGKWKFYDEKRKLNRVSFYENGEEVENPSQ